MNFLHHDFVSSLNNEGKEILLDNDDDGNNLKSPISPILSNQTQIKGLVLECGGPNLKEFFNKHNHDEIDAIHRVHILRDILIGLEFLHSHKVVHGDLKLENIVSFSFLQEGMMKWKIIDFDTSFIEGNIITTTTTINNLRITPEYSSPELIQFINNNNNNINNNDNNKSNNIK